MQFVPTPWQLSATSFSSHLSAPEGYYSYAEYLAEVFPADRFYRVFLGYPDITNPSRVAFVIAAARNCLLDPDSVEFDRYRHCSFIVCLPLHSDVIKYCRLNRRLFRETTRKYPWFELDYADQLATLREIELFSSKRKRFIFDLSEVSGLPRVVPLPTRDRFSRDAISH
jgi:hypothetical protein